MALTWRFILMRLHRAQTLLWPISKPKEDLLSRLTEQRDFRLDHIPDDVKIQPKISVSDHVAEPGRLGPIHIGRQSPRFLRQMLRCFSNDL